MAPPRLGHAISCIAVPPAAVITITIAPIATVNTTTKVPRSNRCSPQDGNISMPEVPEVQEYHLVQCGRGHAMTALALWDGGGVLLGSIVLVHHCILIPYSTN